MSGRHSRRSSPTPCCWHCRRRRSGATADPICSPSRRATSRRATTRVSRSRRCRLRPPRPRPARSALGDLHGLAAARAARRRGVGAAGTLRPVERRLDIGHRSAHRQHRLVRRRPRRCRLRALGRRARRAHPVVRRRAALALGIDDQSDGRRRRRPDGASTVRAPGRLYLDDQVAGGAWARFVRLDLDDELERRPATSPTSRWSTTQLPPALRVRRPDGRHERRGDRRGPSPDKPHPHVADACARGPCTG